MKGFRPQFGTASDSAPAANRRGRVVNYADADADLRMEMQKLIDPIDRNPDSGEALRAYAEAPLVKFDKWSHDLENLFAKLPSSGTMPPDNARVFEKMALVRIEITRELNTYIGASLEVLRRYNEEYIPFAHKACEASQEPEDELYLHDTLRMKEKFIDRVVLLEQTRASSVVIAQMLRVCMEENDVSKQRDEYVTRLQPALKQLRERNAAGFVAAPRGIKVMKPLSFKPSRSPAFA